MKVLLLGGTGAIGKQLTNLLSVCGIDTFVTSRKKREDGRLIKYIKGNAQDLEFLKEILSGNQWDAIVDFMVYSTTKFTERINLLLSSTFHYIFISSARVYADSNYPITESSLRLLDICEDQIFLSTDEYSLAKARQEDILESSGSQNWTIIRPYITFSETRLQLGVFEKEEWLYRALHGRTIVFSKDIYLKKTTMTYGNYVAKGIFSILGNTKSLGETYNITTQETFTWKEILSIYLEVFEKRLGYQPKVLLQDLDDFLECKPTKYQVIYDRLFNRQFDNSKIARGYNIDKFAKTDVQLRVCLEEFLKEPSFQNINWKTEAIKDRQSGEFTPLKEIPGIKHKIKYLVYRFFSRLLIK
jgi:nucleoside-diphosphate-sugar epimerase